MIIREFLTLLGFKSEDDKLIDYSKALDVAIKATAALAVATGVLGTALLKAAGDMEQTEIAFETMLGSAEKADKLIKEITQFAATTPFELKGLVESSKKLLAFGFDADSIIETMTHMGNIAAGIGREKLPTLIASFGKIKTKGKATMEELNMMLEAGVPILDQLAKNMGVTTKELTKMITKGKVGFSDVQKALKNLGTGEGGVVNFGGLMEKQSKTFLGIISNIGDTIENLSVSIGKELLPAAKGIAKAFLDFLEANKEFIKTNIVKYFERVAFVIAVVFFFLQRVFNRLKKFIGGLKGLDKLGEVLYTVFLGLIHVIGTVVKFFMDFVKVLFDYHEIIVPIVAALGAFIVTVKTILFLMKAWVIITKAWAAVQALVTAFAMANPMVLIIAGIVALITAIFFLVQNWDKVVKFLEETGQAIVDFLTPLWEGFKEFFGTLWDDIVASVTSTIDALVLVFQEIGSIVVNALTTAWEGFSSFFIGIWDAIVKNVSKLVDDIVKKFLEIKGNVGKIAKFIEEVFLFAFGEVEKFFTDIINNITKGFDDFLKGIENIGKDIEKFFGDVGAFFGIVPVEEATRTQPTAPTLSSRPPISNRNNMMSTTNQYNINSTPTITVPPGTPESQQEFVRTAAKEVYEAEWNNAVRNSVNGTANVDFAGGF